MLTDMNKLLYRSYIIGKILQVFVTERSYAMFFKLVPLFMFMSGAIIATTGITKIYENVNDVALRNLVHKHWEENSRRIVWYPILVIPGILWA